MLEKEPDAGASRGHSLHWNRIPLQLDCFTYDIQKYTWNVLVFPSCTEMGQSVASHTIFSEGLVGFFPFLGEILLQYKIKIDD